MFNRLPKLNQFGMPNQDSYIDIENNTGAIDIDVSQAQSMNQNMNVAAAGGITSAPIMEPVRERVVHRRIDHLVPHVCPVRTKIVNHHVYQHTYQPHYSCCEENVCEQVQCGSCCNF